MSGHFGVEAIYAALIFQFCPEPHLSAECETSRVTLRLLPVRFSGQELSLISTVRSESLPVTSAPSTYYIDESGHSGDVASARALDFANQPVFALACIGVDDTGALTAELERLRVLHGCGPGELKSTMARLPQFIADLTVYIERHDLSLFVELVDKRFFIAIHIVNHLLCGGIGVDRVPMDVRNLVAEFLADEPSDAILLNYIALCRTPDMDALLGLFERFWWWLDQSDDDVARIGQVLLMEARDRARAAGAGAGSFLPIADRAATDRLVWMLPNLTSLTNIYGRINRSRAGNLAGVTLVHDEQHQYGGILADSKALMETLAGMSAVPLLPFADYRVTAEAVLRFANHETDPCLQAADLIAGCAMRFARDASGRKRGADRALSDAFFELLGLTNPWKGRGINLVFTGRMLARMDVPVHAFG